MGYASRSLHTLLHLATTLNLISRVVRVDPFALTTSPGLCSTTLAPRFPHRIRLSLPLTHSNIRELCCRNTTRRQAGAASVMGYRVSSHSRRVRVRADEIA